MILTKFDENKEFHETQNFHEMVIFKTMLILIIGTIKTNNNQSSIKIN